MGPTVILIGAARSGTKLLRSLVARHPGIGAVPYDINYVWRFGNETVAHDELHADTVTDRTRNRIRAYVGHYRAPAGGVVEKTVSNTLRVPFVDAVFSDARYVHLIRDGRDVIASSYEQWTATADWRYVVRKAFQFPLLQAPGYAFRYATEMLRGGSSAGAATRRVWGPRYRGIDEDLADRSLLEVCALQWVNSVKRALAALAVLPVERVLTIRYERLVRDPGGSMVRVGEHIGVDPAPYATDYSDSVDRRCAGRYHGRLSPERLLSIERMAEPELKRLGYRADPIRLRSAPRSI